MALSCLETGLWLIEHMGFAVMPLWGVDTSKRGEDGRHPCLCPLKEACRAPGKHPIKENVRGGKKYSGYWSTKDPNELRREFHKHKRANLGIATGIASGVWVFDVDPRNGGDGSLARIQKFCTFPTTLRVRTGSGGEHYYFCSPDEFDAIKNNLSPEYPGIDLKSEGGQVVAPSSIHASGERYEWFEGDTIEGMPDACEAPQFVKDLVSAPAPIASQYAFNRSVSLEQSVFYLLGSERGLVGRKKRMGGVAIEGRCPFNATHSYPVKEGHFDSSFVWMAPREGSVLGWGHCLHAHCYGNDAKKIISALGADSVRQVEQEILYEIAEQERIERLENSPGTASEDDRIPGEYKLAIVYKSNKSDVELARQLLKHMTYLHLGIAPVQFQDAVYCYHNERGIWEVFRRKNAVAYCNRFEGGAFPTDDGELKPLSINQGRKISIAACLLDECAPLDLDLTGISLRNGFLSIERVDKRFKLTARSPDNKATHWLDIVYKEQHEVPPVFLKFLQGCFRGDPDCDAKIDRILEQVGACVAGDAASYAKVLRFRGDGQAGKGTTLELIEQLFPPALVSHVKPEKFGNPNTCRQLDGKLLNVVHEAMQSGPLRTMDEFKTIVEGKPFLIKELYKDDRTIRSTAGHFIAQNASAEEDDGSNGFWRRQDVIWFNNPVSDQEKDPFLLSKISVEREEILNVALTKYGAALKRGAYTLVDSSVQEIAAQRQEGSPVAAFLAEALGPPSKADDGTPHEIAFGNAYDTFVDWCKKYGRKLKSKRELGIAIRREYGAPEESNGNSWYKCAWRPAFAIRNLITGVYKARTR